MDYEVIFQITLRLLKYDAIYSISVSIVAYEDEISFAGSSQNLCVCFISMIGFFDINRNQSITHNDKQIGKYQSIFINTMAAIARSFNAQIVKSSGSSIMIYFPRTLDPTNTPAFKDILECCLTMIAANHVINSKLHEEGLSSSSFISYKISANYGKVEVARSGSSQNIDLFGSTVNICSKINAKAIPNGMVIGGDLYKILKKDHFSYLIGDYPYHYIFKEVSGYFIDLKEYPVYSVSEVADSSSSRSYNSRQEEENGNKVNIMLIDDEPDALLTYKTFLSSEGYAIEAFTDPKEALKRFIELDPSYFDLVITDIRMPNLNGLQLYYRLTAISMAIKILFISALDAIEETISVLPRINHNNIIRKPVEKEYFINKVKTLLA
jgi:two-component system, OmpR family, response regulator ChvI